MRTINWNFVIRSSKTAQSVFPRIGCRRSSEVREGRCEVLAPEGLEAREPQWRGLFDGRGGRRRRGSPQETVRVVVGVLDDLVSLILAIRALVRGQRPNQIECLTLRSQLLLDLFSLFPLLSKSYRLQSNYSQI